MWKIKGFWGTLFLDKPNDSKRCVLFIAGAQKRWTPSVNHRSQWTTSISEMDMPIRLGWRENPVLGKDWKAKFASFLEPNHWSFQSLSLSLSHSHDHSHSISLSLSLSDIISGQWGHFNTTQTYELGFRMHLDTYVYVYNHWENV